MAWQADIFGILEHQPFFSDELPSTRNSARCRPPSAPSARRWPSSPSARCVLLVSAVDRGCHHFAFIDRRVAVLFFRLSFFASLFLVAVDLVFPRLLLCASSTATDDDTRPDRINHERTNRDVMPTTQSVSCDFLCFSSGAG